MKTGDENIIFSAYHSNQKESLHGQIITHDLNLPSLPIKEACYSQKYAHLNYATRDGYAVASDNYQNSYRSSQKAVQTTNQPPHDDQYYKEELCAEQHHTYISEPKHMFLKKSHLGIPGNIRKHQSSFSSEHANRSYEYVPSSASPFSSQSLTISSIARQYIRKVNENDVLCGRGGATNVHIGNRSFRSLVKKHQDEYLKAKKKDKLVVAAFLVDIVRKKIPPGRFLKKDDARNLWYDVGDAKAREKTSQALREGAPRLRKKKSPASPELKRVPILSTTENEHPNKKESGNKETEARDIKSTRPGFHEETRPKKREVFRSALSMTKRKFAAISVEELSRDDRILFAEFEPPRARNSRDNIYCAY